MNKDKIIEKVLERTIMTFDNAEHNLVRFVIEQTLMEVENGGD